MRPTVKLLRLGRLDYLHALKVQQVLATKLKADAGRGANPEHYLVLLEHTPVYTIGIRTKDYGVDKEEKLRKLGAEFVRSDRGGLITFHGPGQLIIYPIIHLASFAKLRKSVRNYVCQLEQSVIETCRSFGVETMRTKDTGVWIRNKPLKIAAIGIHCARYVTTHGAALNCNTDLTWFDHIVPCGLEGKGVTSLSVQTNRDITIGKVEQTFVKMFQECFECSIR